MMRMKASLGTKTYNFMNKDFSVTKQQRVYWHICFTYNTKIHYYRVVVAQLKQKM